MPGHLLEFLLCLLCRLVISPSSVEGIPAALACLLPSPPSLIVLASLETPSENTCSRFTSVSLVLKMAQKQLCQDGSNGTPAKKKKSQPGGAAAKKTPKQTTPNQMNQATQYLWWRSNFFDWLLCPFSLFFWWRTFFVKPLYVYLMWASTDVFFQFLPLLLLLLLDIFNPLKPSDTVIKEIKEPTLCKEFGLYPPINPLEANDWQGSQHGLPAWGIEKRKGFDCR